jgi:hypothetical protein
MFSSRLGKTFERVELREQNKSDGFSLNQFEKKWQKMAAKWKPWGGIREFLQSKAKEKIK